MAAVVHQAMAAAGPDATLMALFDLGLIDVDVRRGTTEFKGDTMWLVEVDE